MRRIVHLSDIHFNHVDHGVVALAVQKINELKPHLVVVSGDLTQRARSSEFVEAKRFLDALPQPQIVVPGNHDVPLYNVFERFTRPLHKFCRYITPDLTPTHLDDELAIVGINTARSFVIKGGRINEQQIAHIQAQMCNVNDDMLKVVVTHHPFDLPDGFDDEDIVGRAQKAMPRIAECGADVFLAGHMHVSHIVTTAKRYPLENGRSALVIQAGTATSVRGRGEPHSFNLIEFESPMLKVHRLECKPGAPDFSVAETREYAQTTAGWTPNLADSA
jgi:3',5'-cyclic AMP phosphodiesterase CpdA